MCLLSLHPSPHHASILPSVRPQGWANRLLLGLALWHRGHNRLNGKSKGLVQVCVHSAMSLLRQPPLMGFTTRSLLSTPRLPHRSRPPAFIIPPNNTHAHSSTSQSPSHFEVLHTHRTEMQRRDNLNFHSSLLSAPEEFIKASAGVCAPRCTVRAGV